MTEDENTYTVHGVAIVGLETEITLDPEHEMYKERAREAMVEEAERLGVMDAEPLVEVDIR